MRRPPSRTQGIFPVMRQLNKVRRLTGRHDCSRTVGGGEDVAERCDQPGQHAAFVPQGGDFAGGEDDGGGGEVNSDGETGNVSEHCFIVTLLFSILENFGWPGRRSVEAAEIRLN